MTGLAVAIAVSIAAQSAPPSYQSALDYYFNRCLDDRYELQASATANQLWGTLLIVGSIMSAATGGYVALNDKWNEAPTSVYILSFGASIVSLITGTAVATAGATKSAMAERLDCLPYRLPPAAMAPIPTQAPVPIEHYLGLGE